MAIKDNWVLLQNSYSVVSVWGTEDTFIQHGFRTALVPVETKCPEPQIDSA